MDTVIVTDTIPLNTSCALADGGVIFGGVDSSSHNWGGQQPSCDDGSGAVWTYLAAANGGDTFNNGETVELRYRIFVTKPLPDQETIVNDDYNVISINPGGFKDSGTEAITHTVNAPNWQITKTVVPTPTVEPGDVLSYTLTILNNGHLTTTGSFTITDELPKFTQFLNSPQAHTVNNGQISWVITDPVGLNESVTVAYEVTATLGLTNGTAIVNETYNVTGGNVFSPAAGSPITVTVQTPVTLTLTKLDDPDPVPAGDQLNYTIIVTNNTSSKGPASDVIITDTFPGNINFVGAGFASGTSGTVTNSAVAATWQLTDPIPIGQARVLTLTLSVDTPLPNGTVLTNLVDMSVSNEVATILKDPVEVTTTVVSTPALHINKVDFPHNVEAGELLTYTITYSNSGNADGTNVFITDTLDSRVIFQGASGTPAGSHDGSPQGGTVTWNLGTLAGEGAGQGILTVTVVVTAPLPDDSILTNTVTITSSENISTTDVVTTIVNSTPDFRITKEVTPSPLVDAGERLTYTLTISNVGNGNGINVGLVDVIPTNTSFFTATAGYAPASPTTGNPITWTIATLPLNTPQVYTLVVLVDNPLPNNTVITNAATLADAVDSQTSNTVTTTVVSTPTLEIFKVGLPDPVSAGGLITYTIRYTNSGTADALNTVITDVFPANTTFSSESSTPDVGAGSVILAGQGRLWNTGTISGNGTGGVITLTLSVAKPQDNGTVLTNTALIAGDSILPNIGIATNTITSAPILDIEKIVSQDPVKAGSTFTYTLRYTNTGNMNATGVVITDTYDGPGTISGASPPGVIIAPQVRWAIGGVPADSTPREEFVTITLPGSVPDNTVITNAATIVSVQAVSDTHSITTTARGLEADLQLTKSRVGSGDVIAGELITYTIAVTNGGGDTVNAVVTDTFNNGEASFVSCTLGCSGTASPIVWTLNNFTNSQTLQLVISTNGSVSTTLRNTAFITPTSILDRDTNPDNNRDNEDTIVRFPVADLKITKSRVGSGPAISGQVINYTILITNAGPDTVDTVVTDTFNLGQASYVTCSPNTPPSIQCQPLPPPNNNQVTWLIDNFTGTQTLNLSLRSDTMFTGTLSNMVEISSSVAMLFDPNDADNKDNEDVPVRYPTADLGVSKDRIGSGTVVAGDRITYTIIISNTGPDDVDALVTDNYNIAEADTVVECGGCTNNGLGQLTWPISGLGFGDIQVKTLVLKTANGFTGTLTNRVSITHTNLPAVDPDPSDDNDSVDTPVRLPEANLAINKERIGSGDVVAGGLITYSITITNISGDTVDARVFDTFTLNSASILNCDKSCVTGVNDVTWTINNLAPGTNDTLQLILITSPTFTGTLLNSAEITFTVTSLDPDPGNNRDDVPTQVRFPTADLQISKHTVLTQAVAGGLITYTLRITNSGPDLANVAVTDLFDSNRASFVSCSDGCTDGGGGNVTWTINALSGSQLLDLTLRASSSFSGTFANTGQIGFSGGGVEAKSGDESSTVNLPVVIITKFVYLPLITKASPSTPPPTPDGPDLVITGFSINPAAPGSTDTVVVTVVIQNQGNQATGEGFWTDFYVNPNTLPNEASLGRDRRWKIPAINAIKGIGWQVPALNPGESVTLTSDGSVGIGPVFDPPANDITRWDGKLAVGSYALYAFVDSFDANDATGPTNVEVVETNENNNMSSPINIVVNSSAGDEDQGQVAPPEPEMPGPRPDVGQ